MLVLLLHPWRLVLSKAMNVCPFQFNSLIFKCLKIHLSPSRISISTEYEFYEVHIFCKYSSSESELMELAQLVNSATGKGRNFVHKILFGSWRHSYSSRFYKKSTQWTNNRSRTIWHSCRQTCAAQEKVSSEIFQICQNGAANTMECLLTTSLRYRSPNPFCWDPQKEFKDISQQSGETKRK